MLERKACRLSFSEPEDGGFSLFYLVSLGFFRSSGAESLGLLEGLFELDGSVRFLDFDPPACFFFSPLAFEGGPFFPLVFG